MSQLAASKDQMLSFLSQASKSGRSAKIDWYESSVCYEDSDGDLNVISDDDDLQTAF